MTSPHAPSKTVAPPTGLALVLETSIAGIPYYDFHDGRMPVDAGMPVKVVREAANDYDANAIAIYTPAGAKLGYIPRRKNPLLARLMDAGWPLSGRVERVETPHPGLGDPRHSARRASIDISIFVPRYEA